MIFERISEEKISSTRCVLKSVLTCIVVFLVCVIIQFALCTMSYAETVATGAIDIDVHPKAPGIALVKNEKANIDYSNITHGYVMAKYTANTDKRLKVQVKGPTTTYTYDIKSEKWDTFPLSDGKGDYVVKIYENLIDQKYIVVLTAEFKAELENDFAPFIRPNQYVNYEEAPNTVAKAKSLTKKTKGLINKVGKIYNYVVKNFSYDYKKAKEVKSGYLPILDLVLKEKKGICFDYASIMTGMLRSQNIPSKLIIGYAGEEYHAWISVYSKKTGWIDKVIFFDGKNWKRMDPTFASSSSNSRGILKYVDDDRNYTAKYFY